MQFETNNSQDTVSLEANQIASKRLLTAVGDYLDEYYVPVGSSSAYASASQQILLTFPCEMHNAPTYETSEYEHRAFDLGESTAPSELSRLLTKLDASFSETLLTLIDHTGKTDAEIYKKAQIDRKLFSKIRNSKDYRPSKTTALAFAFALELNLEETQEFIARAGFILSHSNKFDIIVEYFIVNERFDITELNEVLFAFDQPLLGA